ncbi:MAG: hypothetical protein M3437_09965 [Chloroflexota bacterium]|nr:hypothetical protein [Chloroflexota bacterium]MDQ5865415.1 hypothetical protein [Chloroflexota bacterium]
MSEDFVRSVLKEHLQKNMPNTQDPWLAIRGRIQAEKAERPSMWAARLRPMSGAVAVAVAFLLVVAGTLLFLEQPRPAGAEQIFAQAVKVSKDGPAGAIRSGYVMVQSRSRVLDPHGTVTDAVREGRTETWYEAPDKVFSHSRSRTPEGIEAEGMTLEDGHTLYATLSGHEEVRIMKPRPGGTRIFSPLDTEQLFAGPTHLGPVEKPYTVTLVGTEQVAGRTAYVLEWNVTPEVLGAEAGNDFSLVRHKYRLWIDREFYLVLKLQAWNRDGVLIDESQVEALELNKPVDRALFEFDPPAGYVVADTRPASANDVAAGWREVSRELTVTLYESHDTADDALELRKPYYVTTQGVVTQALVRAIKDREVLHAVVVQGPPSAIDESRLGSSAPVSVGTREGRLYKRNEAYYLVFDIEGTRIMLYSSNVSEDGSVERDLVRIGESLVPVGKK